MSNTVREALNLQINREFASAYLYLAMSAWLDRNERPGAAHWMKLQYAEEIQHVERFFNYMTERSYSVEFEAIDRPKGEWESVLDIFEDALAHEKQVSAWINELVDISIKEKDHATNNFLQWYVAEQVEEESNASAIIGQLKMIDGNGYGMFMLDKELGQRVLTPAPAV
ncbi:MAG: ferritin [Bacteriovoracaceae bacterium]|nr:ferritin [Bacteriovoracaceae bacterium]